ncbi:DUF4232 domain-containing protein [Streptantibioticus ferralitis]|uniref:DUF4232 domain-containing protein n=1 Tax=Streptantibioticus ferralitis TaxID=236510 RepID=A0ABT5YWU7_9ACTN|nr:DUF4232 domain-containing protein [Streptantibioticus ferralitis]MDF2255943.1 DUF4232 domain-containing protein [Streptantibioticus ferralitis]
MPTRTARWGLSTAVLVAAGMALTACGPNDPTSAPTSSSSATQPTAGSATGGGTTGNTTSDPNHSTGNGSGTGGGSAAGATCRTANLSFSSSGGMAEGEVLINLKNVGSKTCSMHGFPGVDLKGKDGTVSAVRGKMTAPKVTLSPGQTTNFTLHYPPNNSGGSGVTFTSVVVTPPNETHSHTLSFGINVPAESNSAPTITVDPVGAGK